LPAQFIDGGQRAAVPVQTLVDQLGRAAQPEEVPEGGEDSGGGGGSGLDGASHWTCLCMSEAHVAVGTSLGRILLLDPSSGALEAALEEGTFPQNGLDFPSQRQSGVTVLALRGKRLLSSATDGPLRLWDIPSRTCQWYLQGHSASVHSLDASCFPLLASAAAFPDVQVRVWRVDQFDPMMPDRAMHCLEGHSKGCTCLKLSPRGERLVTGGKDCTVRVWDPEGGYPLAVFMHKQTVTCVTMPSADKAASGSDDCAVKVWDLHRFKEAGAFVGHHMAISGVHLEGSQLVTSSHDGSTKVWRTDDSGRARMSFPEDALTTDMQTLHKTAVRSQVVAGDLLVTQALGQFPILRVFNAPPPKSLDRTRTASDLGHAGLGAAPPESLASAGAEEAGPRAPGSPDKFFPAALPKRPPLDSSIHLETADPTKSRPPAGDTRALPMDRSPSGAPARSAPPAGRIEATAAIVPRGEGPPRPETDAPPSQESGGEPQAALAARSRTTRGARRERLNTREASLSPPGVIEQSGAPRAGAVTGHRGSKGAAWPNCWRLSGDRDNTVTDSPAYRAWKFRHLSFRGGPHPRVESALEHAQVIADAVLRSAHRPPPGAPPGARLPSPSPALLENNMRPGPNALSPQRLVYIHQSGQRWAAPPAITQQRFSLPTPSFAAWDSRQRGSGSARLSPLGTDTRGRPTPQGPPITGPRLVDLAAGDPRAPQPPDRLVVSSADTESAPARTPAARGRGRGRGKARSASALM
jgi:WD40 repeat protein